MNSNKLTVQILLMFNSCDRLFKTWHIEIELMKSKIEHKISNTKIDKVFGRLYCITS